MDERSERPPWGTVTLGVARDRSAAGWMFTNREHVREALLERQLGAAVQAEGPIAAQDMILARIAANPDGAVATLPEPGGPLVPGPHLTDVISDLAHALRTTIMVDGQILIGPAGVPVEEPPQGMTEVTADRRMVYAWPGTDRHVATAAVTASRNRSPGTRRRTGRCWPPSMPPSGC